MPKVSFPSQLFKIENFLWLLITTMQLRTNMTFFRVDPGTEGCQTVRNKL